jgi:DNA-binding transcriptional MerR regulator
VQEVEDVVVAVTLDRVNDPLLGIGEFSRRSRLSPKALRLYERRGLLVPAHVDADTRYRSYRESQLATARLIAVLRGLDMPLSVVSELVAAPDAERVRVLDEYWAREEARFASQRRLARTSGSNSREKKGATRCMTCESAMSPSRWCFRCNGTYWSPSCRSGSSQQARVS